MKHGWVWLLAGLSSTSPALAQHGMVMPGALHQSMGSEPIDSYSIDSDPIDCFPINRL